MSQEIFKRVVENAVDFLNRAIADLEASPKHSVIAFYTGVELFLKARLLAEHWSLVVSSKQSPDLDAFMQGDFQSVTLREAATKLDKAVKSGLTPSELAIFEKVGKHRNKMVHFYHEAANAAETEARRVKVLKELLHAWYSLNVLLTERWKAVFEPWSADVQTIDRSLRAQRHYLDAIFAHRTPDIEKAIAEGYLIQDCPSCGYASCRHSNIDQASYRPSCIVCGFSETALRIDCPSCQQKVIFIGDGWQTCDGCGEKFEPDSLAEILDDEGARHVAAMEGDFTPYGNCDYCDGYHTIVTTADRRFVCTGCLQTFESLEYCGWCGDPNSGDMEYSGWKGCNHCDGQGGWERDD